MGRDIAAFMRWGDIQVGLQAEGVSWSTDVADDMTRRVAGMFREAMDVAKENGFFDIIEIDEFDDLSDIDMTGESDG